MKRSKAAWIILGLALWSPAFRVSAAEDAPPPREREDQPDRERIANRERELARELEMVRNRATELDRELDRLRQGQGQARAEAREREDQQLLERMRARRERELRQGDRMDAPRDHMGARPPGDQPWMPREGDRPDGFRPGRFGPGPFGGPGAQGQVCPQCKRPFGPMPGQRCMGRGFDRAPFAPGGPGLRNAPRQQRWGWPAPRLTPERRAMIRERLDELDRLERDQPPPPRPPGR